MLISKVANTICCLIVCLLPKCGGYAATEGIKFKQSIIIHFLGGSLGAIILRASSITVSNFFFCSSLQIALTF